MKFITSTLHDFFLLFLFYYWLFKDIERRLQLKEGYKASVYIVSLFCLYPVAIDLKKSSQIHILNKCANRMFSQPVDCLECVRYVNINFVIYKFRKLISVFCA